jgi:hypothetical protein
MLALAAAATVSLVGTPKAHALTPAQVIAAVQVAYDTYKKFSQSQLTLQQATTQIINSINSAKNELKAHIDQIAEIPVRSCAQTTVIDFADFPQNMSVQTRENFARDATLCATTAKETIASVASKSSVNRLGYALNTVGPIALLARSYTGLTAGIPALKSELVTGNNTLVTKLNPSCTASPLWGDAEPGAPVEVILRCTAFNGQVGVDSVIANIRRGRPLPAFDYTDARRAAMVGTAWELANAVLPKL